MNNWNQFLVLQGANISDERISDFGKTLTAAELADGFVAPVTDQGLIGITGDDAASFLHSQLTNDVEHLTSTQVRLAGYCSPKGRLLASFLMWRNETTIYLQLPRDIQAALQKRLQMFVLRAKAKLHDASADEANQVILGIGGAKADVALQRWFASLPGAAHEKLDHQHGTLLRVADAFGAPRYQWLMSASTAASVWPLLVQTLSKGGNDAWRLSEVHAGVPQIGSATQEQFVPQMVNYELLGGVNFKKGCYPGQEIVARSQYLGKLKRRTTLVSIADSSAKPGDEVFAVADPEQPCGMIVNAAPNGDGGIDALVEMKLAAISQGHGLEQSVRLGSASGAPLRFLSMPYVLDALDL
ncbi:CAF17-like 4Fe-4S cluster assembly/insertion protein YgfZ [Janthinobacterium agaricidamnosum]|uniref:Aminomethyltransferase folate-binding domain protein n=1 Tax=Janthinobacterium agaricidamnosum NBRC 102515 = DSM 9628 TaxID=1349767 RepID=W0V5B2_9BURK|nr:folate-binding protein YgfZ [Janthinobacterium agaricidamnosum]CDG83071.1 aminomethyltransferase folate-binding domain protein [Janthinobacterium agaricidamnosum NBRC 102515 = DSM 9628]